MICCANCYGVISGYVGVKAKVRLSRWLSQWFQVWFYSSGIALVFRLLNPNQVSDSFLLWSFFPVSTNLYWYFSAYTGLYLFMPLLNHVLQSMERKTIGSLIVLTSVVFGFCGLLPQDAMTLQSGYSVLWLMLLYLCGGWIRLYGHSNRPKRFWLMVWLLSSAAMLVCKLISDYTFLHYDFRILERLYSTYSSPLVLCGALALLMIFSQIQIKRERIKRIVLYVSPACFGIYLIHVHHCVWTYLLSQRFAWISGYPIAPLILLTAAGGIGIFIVCMAIDLIRIRVFRWLHVREAAEKLGALLEKTGRTALSLLKL